MQNTTVCLLIIILIKVLNVNAALNENVKATTLQFYINLHEKYSQYNKNNISKQALTKKIEHLKVYLQNKYNTKRNEFFYKKIHGTSKNSVFHFDKFATEYIFEFKQIKDIHFFLHKINKNNNLYAASLESDLQSGGSILVIYIYKNNDETWDILWQEKIVRSDRINSLPVLNGSILTVSYIDEITSHNGMFIYFFNLNNKLQKVQILKTTPCANIVSWKMSSSIYMALATDDIKNKKTAKCEQKSQIYIWKGFSFHRFQFIETTCTKKITHFIIGAMHYLAVANHQNNNGVSKIFSDIYIFDYYLNKFILFQKLACDGAIDVQHFNIQVGSYKENYLLIENKNEENENSKTIIYKYVNSMFIPIQIITLVGSPKWHIITDSTGKLVLLALSESGRATVFQYNGWIFNQSKESSFQKERKTILKTFILSEFSFLGIVMNDGNKSLVKFYRPLFKSGLAINHLINEMTSWCESFIHILPCKIMQHRNVKKILALLESITKKKILTNEFIKNVRTEYVKADDTILDSSFVHNINDMYISLLNQMHSMQELDDLLSSPMINSNTLNTQPLSINTITFDCAPMPCNLEDIEIIFMNNKNMAEFQTEVFHTEYSGNLVNHYSFDTLRVDEINNIKMNNTIIYNLVKSHGIEINGTVHLHSNVFVEGFLDKINFTSDHVLLKKGSQYMKEYFEIPRTKTTFFRETTNHFINKIKVYLGTHKTPLHLLKFTDLNVNKIFVNHFDIDFISESTLKTTGDQIVRGFFSILSIKALDITSRTSFKNFIPIKNGLFIVDEDIEFQDISVTNLTIRERLNNIQILNNHLLLLLLNSTKLQFISGNKSFEQLEIINHLNLQGRINSQLLERFNPIRMMGETFVLKGSISIFGNVSIDGALTSVNIIRKQ